MDASVHADDIPDACDPAKWTDKSLEEIARERSAAFCDGRLDVVCRCSQPQYNFCDFDAVAAHDCERSVVSEAVKNSCGGLTRIYASPFSGRDLWHYNDKHELIGASLHSDTSEYCGKLAITIGEDCAPIGEMFSLHCAQRDE